MKTIVLYTSKTGNTAKYAEEIASQVGADVKPLKKFRWKKELKDYDCIVFGGWVMGGKTLSSLPSACRCRLPTEGRNSFP